MAIRVVRTTELKFLASLQSGIQLAIINGIVSGFNVYHQSMLGVSEQLHIVTGHGANLISKMSNEYSGDLVQTKMGLCGPVPLSGYELRCSSTVFLHLLDLDAPIDLRE